MKRAVALLALLSAPALATALRPFAAIGNDSAFGWNTPNGSPISIAPSPSFDFIPGLSTPNDLSDTLTVNNVALDLVCSLTAQDVSGTNLVGRTQSGAVTFSETGAGTSPVVSALTPAHALDASERGVFYNPSQKYHQAGVNDCDIGSEDFVIEGVFGPARASNAAMFVNSDASNGFTLQNNSSSNLRLVVRTGGVAATIDGGPPGAWNHAIWFVDRDEASTNGAFAYTNGAPGTGVNVSARTGSLASTAAASLGTNAVSSAATVVGLRIWKCPAGTPQCFAGGATNPAQWALIARERSARAFGVFPAIAAGSAIPTTNSRNTTAHVDVVDGNTRQIYLLGVNAQRVSVRTHSGGAKLTGWLDEIASTNIALQSQTLEATWTPITVGDNVLTNAYAGADLTVTGDNIDGADVLGEHGLRQSITLTAVTHTFSAWARAGEQSFVALRNNTIANGTAWFDVATCTSASCTIGEDCAAAVGTVQAGVSRASAERYPIDTTGDGVADVSLCRMSISYTGAVAAHDHDLLCAPSNGVTSYTDSGAAADCGFWGVRVEALGTPSSYLASTTSGILRNGDDIRFDGASNYTGSPSTIDAITLCQNYAPVAQSIIFSVGNTSATFAGVGFETTRSAVGSGVVTSTVQWSIAAGSGSVSDGVRHSIRQTMETNNVIAYFDGASIGTDNTATIPPAASSFIYFGSGGGGFGQPVCLISRARLWSFLVAP